MRRLLALRGGISPFAYAVVAPALLLLQHGTVMLAYGLAGASLRPDIWFWVLPLRTLAGLPGLSAAAAAVAFAFSLAVAWFLALLSYRRASVSGVGYGLAALAVVPGVQLVAVAVLAILPLRVPEDSARPDEAGANVAHVLQGLLAGVAIIVLAVLVSALTLGAYGWGLFVLTPLTVGVTTGYIANRQVLLEPGRTLTLVLASAWLGGLALVALALEGIVCIILAAPLAAAVAGIGGVIGRAAALAGHRRGRPLLSLAVLPAVFAVEAAMPPALALTTHESIDVAAPPAAVWGALTSEAPIASPPGLVGRAGLAYPLGSRIRGTGVGAERLGTFSTGTARERITAWSPERRLAFSVLSQPAAMEEMSPYRRVHAPHVHGYFETGQTSFDLAPLADGGTRLTARATHVLRIDPVLYWEPLARWAINENTGRVLRDLKAKAERTR